jgi:hypothetical protein
VDLVWGAFRADLGHNVACASQQPLSEEFLHAHVELVKPSVHPLDHREDALAVAVERALRFLCIHLPMHKRTGGR